jgi:hypothetical protein
MTFARALVAAILLLQASVAYAAVAFDAVGTVQHSGSAQLGACRIRCSSSFRRASTTRFAEGRDDVGEKFRSRGSLPYLSDQPQSSTMSLQPGMSWPTALPSTMPGQFAPGRTRFPESNRSTPEGFEFSVDPTEALLICSGDDKAS